MIVWIVILSGILGIVDESTKGLSITRMMTTMMTTTMKMKLNLVKLGMAEARTKGLRPIKGLLDMERCVTLKFEKVSP